MVRQDITYKAHQELMNDLEERLSKVLGLKKFQQVLTLGDILTVWQRVMSKRKNGG
jgi:hypothetical protein